MGLLQQSKLRHLPLFKTKPSATHYSISTVCAKHQSGKLIQVPRYPGVAVIHSKAASQVSLLLTGSGLELSRAPGLGFLHQPHCLSQAREGLQI